jgi:DNA-directed RNA polymerase specialized sigma24 family protein
MRAAQRSVGELRFADVKAALRWFFAMQGRMQSPRGVQYGRVDVESVLAEVATIGAALGRLAEWRPEVHDVVVMGIRDGLSQREIARKLGCSQAAVSGMVGRGEAFLAGVLG